MRRRAVLALSAAAIVLVLGSGDCLRHRAAPERRVVGFVVGWDPASLRSMEAHAGDLTHVVADGYYLGEDPGPLSGGTSPAVLAAARRCRLPLLVMISNYERGWRPERVRPLCATPGTRSAFAAMVAREIERRRCRGVNIDFESLSAGDRAGFTALCRALAFALRPRGLLLTVDVPAGSASSTLGAYDLAALARSCDLVIPMLYDEHGATSRPGPVASRNWALREMAIARRFVPAEKLVVGVGAYGYDWGPSGPAEVVGFSGALTTARSQCATVHWVPEARAPFFRYSIDGAPHQVWFEDAASVSGRLVGVRNGGLAGVAVWRLGSEDPSLWSELRAYRTHREREDTLDQALSFADVVQIEGEGDFLTVTPGREGGHRRFYRRQGEVVGERYSELPAAFVVHRSGAPQRQEVALTFDDGPDPKYTPRLLDVLRRERVPAAFFIVGTRALACPGLVRRIYAEGHDLGNHTYSHVNLSTAHPVRARLELNATQRVIEVITGRRTALFRPPYETDSRPRTQTELAPIYEASQKGYLTVTGAIDPGDWSLRNADAIVERCLRDGRAGGVIVLHDAGGDRSATVQALPHLIRAFRGRGYRFVALHDLIGRSREDVMPAGTRNHWGTRLFALTLPCFSPVMRFIEVLALLGLAMSLLRTLVIPLLALWHRRRHRAHPRHEDFRPVSVLVPGFNEERVIGKTLEYLLAAEYPDLEIVVIDDGSTDGTGAAVAPFLHDPRLRYLRKVNGGKGRALNAGLQASQGEIVVCIDADTLFEPTTISHLVRRFEDPRVGAVAGNIKVGNRCGLITQWQSLEYIVSLNLDKRFFDVLNCVTVVPGSVGAWRRAALEHVGGLSPATLAEDTDLTFAVRRAGYRIVFEPSAVAWTEAPVTVSALAKQRLRWTFGTFQCMWKHRGTFLNPRVGALGLVAMPYLLVSQVLLLAGPLMDAWFLGMCLFGQVAGLTLLGVSLSVEWLLAAVALTFEREAKWPLLLVPLQRVAYRQILYWVALKFALCVLKGSHPGWQKLTRSGTAALTPTAVLLAALWLSAPVARADGLAPAPRSSVSEGAPAGEDPDTLRPDAQGDESEASASLAGHLPASLFDFEEFWDLVDRRGAVTGVHAGSYLQPVSDEWTRGAAVRSGTSTLGAISLDPVTTIAIERFAGKTYYPGLRPTTSVPSTWTAVKVTRRLSPGMTVCLSQLTGDATATGLTLGYEREWGPWAAGAWVWSSTDSNRMSWETIYTGFGATLSRSVGWGVRVEAGLEGPLVRGQLGSLTLRYAPRPRTNAAVSLRNWYGRTILEFRGWLPVSERWQVGASLSSKGTFDLFVKQQV